MKRYLLLLCFLAAPLSGGGAAARTTATPAFVSASSSFSSTSPSPTTKETTSAASAPKTSPSPKTRFPKKTATFEEGNGPTRRVLDVAASADGKSLPQSGDKSSAQDALSNSERFAGANVFILFDTSNYIVPRLRLRPGCHCRLHPLPRRRQQKSPSIPIAATSREVAKLSRPIGPRFSAACATTVAGDDAALYNPASSSP